MNLITRCPTCQTMFRVVPDQLRVSGGWVRCGQCGEIFDASQSLMAPGMPSPASLQAPPLAGLDMPAAPPSAVAAPKPAWTEAPAAKLPATKEPLPESAPVAPTLISPAADQRPLRTDPVTPPEAGLADPAADVMAPAEPADPVAPAPPVENYALARADESNAAPIAEAAPAASQAPEAISFPAPRDDTPLVVPPGPVEESTDPIPEPSFMRAARREAAWQRPAMRATLGAALVLLLAMLGLQVSVHERDRLAAAMPAVQSALTTVCAWAGCTVSAPRRVEAILIDSSSFNLVLDDLYRLGFVLRNSSQIVLAMPSVELTLANAQGQTLLRRVLGPVELGWADRKLTPGTDHGANLTLKVSLPDTDERVAGYSLLAFYP